ncbi:hypothetical protein KY290_026143 [Solanum tuberosum]|uniref:Aminotransferase-like plant mobile domain-containing protein n=1 Tax=Solanum tuberosum TaxID=4113 RepID=A0ABQ7UXJ1_SOLTU|nr:hypothetical protein KY289_025238 [Solanum tuberosum]KAH0677215.1 hypothetical protein KY285_025016 [Solanum tuberosum]KAH0755873.1 hypothetical protein KY290_026143 [Solanum tuberosum]
MLQLWATEHFYKRCDMVDIFDGMGNKIFSHPTRMLRFFPPVGTEDWFVYLIERSAYQIQWKYQWLGSRRATVREHELYFIEFIGLNGVQPYAPLQVLCQFGQVQMIPLRSHMGYYGYNFRPETPQVDTILQKDAEHKDLSEGGLPGFGDEMERMWAHNLLNNDYDMTPKLREQIAPNIGDQYF